MRLTDFLTEAPMVYHGSPHDFDQFSTDKIGTGEGNAMYGWGLYFADTQEVAKWYRDKFQFPDSVLFNKTRYSIFTNQAGKDMFDYYSPLAVISDTIKKRLPTWFAADTSSIGYSTTDLEKAEDMMEGWGENFIKFVLLQIAKNRSTNGLQDMLAEFTNTIPIDDDEYELWFKLTDKILTAIHTSISVEKENSTGSFYHAEIPDNAHWIYHDKRWSEQPVYVLRAFFQLFKMNDRMTNWIESRFIPMRNGYEKMQAIERFIKGTRHQRVGYETILSGGEMYDLISKQLGSAKDASLAFNQHGIAGVKFLNGVSRDAGRGGYNYVVFDDSLITIKNKEK